jgi:diguanylate cyclase (GGDEF)-like protein/PAS domain S-box-containing protein
VESGLWDHFRRTLEDGRSLALQDFPYQNDILGSMRRYDIQGARIGDGMSIIWRDVTGRYEAAARLAESEKHFRLLAENTSDVVILMQHWKIAWISPSVETTLGVPVGEWLGRNPADVVHPDDVDLMTRLVEDSDDSTGSVVRLRVGVGGDHFHWMDMNVSQYRDSIGRTAGFIASGRLADEAVAAEAELERLARYDSLTGLLNRGSALDYLERATGAERRTYGNEIGLLFCDIDYFKNVNDTYGHAVGDLVLATIARRIEAVVRSYDVVARMGGDELLVILPRISSVDDAIAVAEKARRAARQPVPVGDTSITVTLSIGATIAHPGESTAALLVRADTAMYQAKEAGRDRVTALRLW